MIVKIDFVHLLNWLVYVFHYSKMTFLIHQGVSSLKSLFEVIANYGLFPRVHIGNAIILIYVFRVIHLLFEITSSRIVKIDGL